MFRFVMYSVVVVSGLVVGQSALRSQRDIPIADEAAQAAQSSSSVPQQINHQGVVSVSGVRFNGVGCFKFAIVDPVSGKNLWCNDDNNPADTPQDCVDEIGVVPATSCSRQVTDGVYSIRLGDTDLACMQLVPSSVFNVNNARLRIWFSDDCTEERFQQLTPDQKLTSAPYAHRTAVMPPIGSIIAWHEDIKDPVGGTDPLPLPDGWERCDGQVLNDEESPLNGKTIPDLNGRLPGGVRRFLRGTTGISGGIENDATKLPNTGGWTVNTHDHSHTVSNGAHTHTIQGHNPGGAQDTGSLEIGGSTFRAQPRTGSEPHTHTVSSDPHNHTITGGDGETRPVNMSVVWIMRVK